MSGDMPSEVVIDESRLLADVSNILLVASLEEGLPFDCRMRREDVYNAFWCFLIQKGYSADHHRDEFGYCRATSELQVGEKETCTK